MENNQTLYRTQKSFSHGLWKWRNSSYMTNSPMDNNHKWENIKNNSACLEKNQKQREKQGDTPVFEGKRKGTAVMNFPHC